MLRAAGLGDLVFALPALAALRSAYPGAEIVLLGDRWHSDFLASRPGPVDRVVTVPGGLEGIEGGVGGGGDTGGELAVFFERMRGERFDVAIQLFGGGRHSNPFVTRLGAGLTVGAKGADAPDLDRCIPYVYYQSEIIRCLEICSLLGVEWAKPEAELALTEADLAETPSELAGAAAIVAVHPGAGAPRRRWPPARFARVADELAVQGATIALTGSGDERGLVASVVDAMTQPAINLAGRLSLGGLAGLYSLSTVVVSNDSGPLHLAHSVGAATVGIYWCGNVINGAPLSRTRHRPAISWVLDCPVCGVNCTEASCPHDASFVEGARVEEVIEYTLELFATRKSGVSEPSSPQGGFGLEGISRA
ncbi:MAG: glycosyltransferase family 9 protein [Actinomycetota bacterium]|nr:glycosyltransferase family 9 protein [Actinomycetota bacterium]